MRSVSLILAGIVASAGCDGKKGTRDEHDEHDEHGEHDPHAGPKAGHPGDGGNAPASHDDHDDHASTIRIAPEMIRDLRVTTTKAESRTAGERVSVLGELRVNEDTYAEVGAPTTARVTRVLARAGDTVTAGQRLVELHSPELGKARAELHAARARVELARKNAERKRALAQDRLIADRERIEADTALADAEAAVTVATAALGPFGGSQGDGARLVITSPIAGTVIDRDVALGRLVDPSRTLFRIGDLSSLWLIAHVFERDAVRVHTGSLATASFAALPGRTVEGSIRWVGREVDPASRTIPVRLEIPNPDTVLRPGMSATVSIPIGDATGVVVAVPLAAVQRVGDQWAVFVPHGPGVFDVRPIGRGRDFGGEVEVLRGIAPGDEIVVDGAFLLKAEWEKARGEGGGHDHH